MNIADLPDDSESSDEDYVPDGTNVELPSEEESDGDVEDDLINSANTNARGSKRRRGTGKAKKKRKNLKESSPVDESPKENKPEEEQKEDTSSLWADFMKDTGFKTRAERSQTSNKTETVTTSSSSVSNEKQTGIKKGEKPQKVKVTEVYKFAGEEVTVEKEVCVESTEGRLGSSTSQPNSSTRSAGGGGRLNSILGNLGKQRKINTLEKSKLDWERFKKEENIEDELHAYGKSKDGYLERQDFLERADLRRFEIEKGIRTTLRNNRMNNL